MGQVTLKISINENNTSIGFTLEGRVAGPWVEELKRVWNEAAARMDGKRFWLDLRNVTYSDANGKTVLRDIYRHTQAELITSSAWSQYLADEIRNADINGTRTEA